MNKTVIFFDLFDTLVKVDRGYLEPYFTREIDRMGDIGELPNAESTIKELTYHSPYLTQMHSIEEMSRYYEGRMQDALMNIDANVLHMLQSLKDAGYELCVISDAAEVDIMHWDESPLAQFFDKTVFSCREHLVKPDPALFHSAQHQMGDPSTSVFVGDGGHSELIGAKAAGMYAIKAEWTKNRREPEICAQADIQLQHPGQLPALMQMLERAQTSEIDTPEQDEPEVK